MSQGNVKQSVFERLYSTQTVSSRRKHETASATISKASSSRSKNSAEINPNSRLFAGTEASKHKHDGDPSLAPEKSMPSRKMPIQRSKGAGIPPSRLLPQKSNADHPKTPAGKATKETPQKSVPRSSNKTQPQTPHESSASPQTPGTTLTSTPNTVQSTPSHSSLHVDATLPTLDDLVDMIEIPIEEKIASLFRSIERADGKGAKLSDIVHELEDRYPDLCTPAAVQSYQQCSDSPTGVLELADFQFFLLFLVYFHILYEDFVFIDDDDLRISKGEFEPVAERLNLFDDLDTAYAEMEGEHEGYIMFDVLCAKCARNKHTV